MPILVYPKESYRLMRVLFDIQNELGISYQERHYQRALNAKLKKTKIPFEKEVPFQIFHENEMIGKFFADFVIYDKILIELKAKPGLLVDDCKQVARYLKILNLKLGVLVNFHQNPLEYKRIINKIN